MKELIVKNLNEVLKKLGVKISKKEIFKSVEIPPSSELGDYSFPCFFLSLILKKNPKVVAAEIKNKLGEKDFDKIEVKGAYLNFFIKKEKFARETISEILKKGENYGKPLNKEKENVVVEFSQPNTHKAFHVGHIRGTSLGESISRIFEFCGGKVIRVNYSGDTGMHVAKWIWCYQKYHSKEKLKKNESWIASIYVDAVKRLTENENLQSEVDEINRKLETKEDKKLNELWKNTRKLSIDSWKKIYSELDAKFNFYFFENDMEKRAKEISLELVKKGFAKKDQGAIIMNLKSCNLGVWVLLRSDGTVLYSAKDLALAEFKIKKFKGYTNLVMVADEQKLHFQQLLKTLEIMKISSTNKTGERYGFITFGLVRLPTGKMSSRTGENILYSEFIDEMTSHAKSEIKKREEKISEKELDKRALNISTASIKYSMLKQSPNKNIIFDKNEAMNFEGDTGSYLLYSCARALSILRKSKQKNKNKLSIKEINEKEMNLVKKLSQFQEVVSNSKKNIDPSPIANYAHSLSQKFNEFYHSYQVIGTEDEQFKISLVKSFVQVMKNSLNLLGIKILEKM